MHGVELLRRGLKRKFPVFEVGFEGVETILQGHAFSVLAVFGTRNLAYSSHAWYTLKMDIIYLCCG